MSKRDMVFYDVPKTVIMLKGADDLRVGSKQKLLGEYLCSNGDKLAMLENFSYLLSFESIEIKGDYVDKSKESEEE